MLSNLELAELLALEAENHEGNKQRAARRAARAALMWPDEVSETLARGDDLKSLPAVGPWVARLIAGWIENPPEPGKPPELRRDFLSYAEARATVATHPAWRSGLRGDLQMHTIYSDGACSVAEIAEQCIELGYSYIAVTDHSKGLAIAGGMDEERLERQAGEIAMLNDGLAGRGFRVLHGLEMNLSPTGEGDMDPDALGSLDIVLGSFHSKLRSKDDQTDRYVAALHNPHIHVLGHPRGRQWNFRLGLSADWPRVFAVAAERGVALEIDSHPNRQDLNVELLKLARDAGTFISIGTDAHYPFELLFVEIGLAAALRAGIEQQRILNFMTADELTAWAASATESAGAL